MKTSSLDLVWFHENAGQILSDLDCCPEGSVPRFFWDTSEVHGAALGYADLYSRVGEFNESAFQSKDYLVRCLMASGWFGPIEMLEPHKAEFITRLGNYLDSQARNLHQRLSPVRATDFLRTALSTEQDISVSMDNLDSLIKAQSGKADVLFKAIQSLGTFEQRISTWKRMKLLNLTYDSKFDYFRTFESSTFDRLRKSLDAERPEMPINNFTDAVSLCLLDEAMREAISKCQPIPLLFASSTVMRRATRTLRSEGFLTFVNKKGMNVTILRYADYYLLRASLWIPPHFQSTLKLSDQIGDLRQMWELTDKYITFAVQANLLGTDSFIEVDESLAGRISQLKRLWFLDRVWIPFAVDKATAENASPFLKEERAVLESAKALSNNLDYRRAILRDVEELRSRFMYSARQYTNLTKTWTRVQESFGKFISYYGYLSEEVDISAVNLFGLVRFGLPSDVEHEVESEIHSFVGLEANRKKAIGNIIMRCLKVLQGNDLERNSVGSLIAVLWILEDDATIDDLIQVFHRNSVNIPLWLYIIHGASLLRVHAKHQRVEDIVTRLRRDLESEQNTADRVQVMIGMSYLNFHIWEDGDRGRLWSSRCFRPNGEDNTNSANERHLQEALAWALKARNTAKIGSGKYLYALNLYIYYTTEGAEQSEFERIEEYVPELLGYCNNRRLWQYRFADTLARFYHRRAMNSEGDARKELLDQAVFQINEAVRLGRGDRRVTTYQAQLKLIRDRVYSSDSEDVG